MGAHGVSYVGVPFADCLRTAAAYDRVMKRTAVISSALLVLMLAGCGSPEPAPTPSTDAERAACMEAEGYPLDQPANENKDFTWEGLREAAAKCGLES